MEILNASEYFFGSGGTHVLEFGFHADIDGQGVMRLIYGIIVVEEKGRVARVDKVMKCGSIVTSPHQSCGTSQY